MDMSPGWDTGTAELGGSLSTPLVPAARRSPLDRAAGMMPSDFRL